MDGLQKLLPAMKERHGYKDTFNINNFYEKLKHLTAGKLQHVIKI